MQASKLNYSWLQNIQRKYQSLLMHHNFWLRRKRKVGMRRKEGEAFDKKMMYALIGANIKAASIRRPHALGFWVKEELSFMLPKKRSTHNWAQPWIKNLVTVSSLQDVCIEYQKSREYGAEGSTSLQGSAKRRSPGWVNFVAAAAYHFCLILLAAFSQPDRSFLAKPCT